MSAPQPSSSTKSRVKFRVIVTDAQRDSLAKEGEEMVPQEFVLSGIRNESKLRVRLATMFNSYGPCISLALDPTFTKRYRDRATLSPDATGVTNLYCRTRPVESSDLSDILRFHCFVLDSDGLTRAKREFAGLPGTGFRDALQGVLYDQLAMTAQLMMMDADDKEFVSWQCEAVRLLISVAGARVAYACEEGVSPIAFLINSCAADDTCPPLPLLRLLLDSQIAEKAERRLDSEPTKSEESSIDLFDDVVRIDPRVGRTPLHICVKLGAHDAVRMILEAVGPDGAKRVLRVQCTVKSDSPLHAAVCREDYEMVKLLCAFGAEVTLRDMMDNTPLQLAQKLMNTDIISVLIGTQNVINYNIRGFSWSTGTTVSACLRSPRSACEPRMATMTCFKSSPFFNCRKASSCSTIIPTSPTFSPTSSRYSSFRLPYAIQNPTSKTDLQSPKIHAWTKKVSFCWAQ
eukprot:GEMP01008503.1.p1 GENE.GEMP01008503.1~~GEMP01008503.1.p1  ORF type:complete len:459 (+),score=96.11 GEMP01008503.1:425-1801(+)